MRNSIKKAACLAGAMVISVSLLAAGTTASAAGGEGAWVTADFNSRTILTGGTTSDMDISGYSWNVPKHETANIGLAGKSTTSTDALSIFKYKYGGDKVAFDYTGFPTVNSVVTEKTVKINGADTKIKYAEGRQQDGKFEAYLDPGATAETTDDVWYTTPQNTYEGVAIDDESKTAIKANLSSKMTNNTHFGAIEAAKYLEENFSTAGYMLPNMPLTNSQFTAGVLKEMYDEAPTVMFGAQMISGSEIDPMLSKVGGAWDTMLSEGRNFWVFGNGEAVKNYTYSKSTGAQDIIDGMRSGNSFTVMGDLITALDYKITNNTATAVMGEALSQISGKSKVVTVNFKGSAVDHIDLIAGEVIGEPATKNNPKPIDGDFEDPDKYLTEEYQNDDVTATTKIIKTFNKSEFKTESDGTLSVTFTIPASDKDMYYRLVGTNAAESLSFYSNPVFVNAQTDGVTISGTLKDASGKALAGKTVETESGVTVTTDSNGKFTLSNVSLDIHTLTVKDSAGMSGELTFNLQRGEKTEFAEGDVWIASGAYEINLEFTLDDELAISKVSDNLPVKEESVSTESKTTGNDNLTDEQTDESPQTGINSMPEIIFITVVGCLLVMVFSIHIKKRENA